MNPVTKALTLALLLAATTATAQNRATILQLPNGQYVGIVYLESGETVLLTKVQVLKLPNPTPPPSKVTAVTYVYEKDTTIIPRPVSFALKNLNEKGIIATEFEQDSVTGTGQVPRQYAAALKAAKDSGIPCLVVEGGGKVIRVVLDPKTEQDVMEAIK